MGKLNRTEIIAIITGLICICSFLLTAGVFKGEFDMNTSFRIENKDLPNQVKINKSWITEHKHMDKELLALQINFKHVTESMNNLSDKLDDTNDFLRKLNHFLPEKILSKNEN